ncbi:hypothetical protein BGX26_011739 [Mortierella sp. AD094]|nr:hypothetical protein BGX26_011739 [Mortierella sp. AD094]
MRVKLVFEDPLPPYKCWYEVPSSCSTIRDLQRLIRKGFRLDQFCKTTRLDLDGFFLLPSSTVAGSVKDGDLLQVMIRKKDDNLPPRSLPAAGGKKRPRESAELPQGVSKNSKRVKTNPPKQTPALNGQSRTPTKPGAGHQGNKPNNANAQKNKQNNPTKPQIKKGNQAPNTNNQKQQNIGPSQNKTRPKSATTIAPPQSGIAKSTTSKQANRMRKVKVVPPEKPKPTKTPSTSSSSSDSSESSGSDSDSSSSDDSSTSDSDSDSDDSSDSGSSSGDSSDSDSDPTPKSSTTSAAVAPATPAAKVPFGCGSSNTKARNMRRKRAALAQTQLTETPNAQTQEQDQGGETSAIASQSSPSTISLKKPSLQSAPKVFMTTIELKDSELVSKASKSTPPKRVTRSSQRFAAGDQPKDTTAGSDPSPTKAKIEAALAIKVDEYQVEDKPDLDAPPRNYEGLPRLEGYPKVGDLIAYKTLEMGPTYTPIISDFKEATITAFSEADMVAEAQLGHKFRVQFEVDSNGNTILGKFDIYDETEIDLAKRGIVSLDMLSLADCRIISVK